MHAHLEQHQSFTTRHNVLELHWILLILNLGVDPGVTEVTEETSWLWERKGQGGEFWVARGIRMLFRFSWEVKQLEASVRFATDGI